MTREERRLAVIVTGASSGIGRATALRFCREGRDVVATGRDVGRLESLRREAVAENAAGRIFPHVADLADSGSGTAVVTAAVGFAGGVDCLVHCAALAPLAAFESVTPRQFDETVALNLRGTFFLLQAAFRRMKEQGRGGVLIGLSSLAAIDPFTGFSVYGSSKAWLDLLIRAIADEGRRHGIRAFSIRPGAVETPMLRGLFPDFPKEKTVSPEAVADAAFDLTRPAWQHSSGQAIHVTAQ